MPAVLIRLLARDPAKSIPALIADGETRAAYGGTDCRVHQDVDDPCDLIFLMSWDEPERARLHAQSDELQQVLALAGAIGHPDAWIPGGGGSHG